MRDLWEDGEVVQRKARESEGLSAVLEGFDLRIAIYIHLSLCTCAIQSQHCRKVAQESSAKAQGETAQRILTVGRQGLITPGLMVFPTVLS